MHTDDLAEREQRKYETMWKVPAYRHYSPGEDSLVDIVATLAMSPGSSIIDFGCGTGRATQTLNQMGYRVTGVDFAPNCLDYGIAVPFVQANLWNLPLELKADAGICCDVMEHVPTEKVDAVLSGIARAVPRCFFKIAFHPDNFGRVIGETLHLTVQSGEWWLERLESHWSFVQYKGNGAFYVEARA